jgi:hypothetical protein
MSAQAMLSLTVDLNIQPGEIPPTIHLKEASDSMFILLRIAADEATLETGGTAILKATRPDGSELFKALPIAGMDAEFISLELESEAIGEMSRVAGTFEGTISIIDSENTISQADYEDYDLITVQPFILEVQPSAAS